MSALPSLLKSYQMRGNAPFPANTSQEDVRRSQWWMLVHMLLDVVATGSTSGTRHANSVWSCYYSCDSVTAGTAGDGVNRWTTYANVIGAASGAAHAWMVLYNANFGLYMLVSRNSTTTGIRMEVSFTAPTGGSTTVDPTMTNSWAFGATSSGVSTTWSGVSDDAAGNFNYAHLITTDDGRFFFLVSRTGSGFFSSFCALLPAVNGRVGDTNNLFTMASALNSSRGAPTHSNLTANNGCVCRTPNNAGIVTTGGVQSINFGGSAYAGNYGIDSVSGDFMSYPLFVMSLASQVAYRGQVPDLYFIGTATVGASVPTVAAQERVIAGDVIVPFPGIVPNI